MSGTPEPTPIGVSVGVETLIAAAPPQGGAGTQLLIDGAHLHERHAILAEATQALQGADFDTTRGESELFVAMWHQLRPQVYNAATRTVRHARRFDAPQIVLADRSVRSGSLWLRRTDSELTGWLPAALRRAVAEKAREAGVAVVRVDLDSSSRRCHECDAWGAVRDSGALVCRENDCPVDRVSRRLNSAVRLARRGDQ